MHFDILVEDRSGKVALDILVPKILGEGTPHTYNVIAYRGVGHIPRGLSPKGEPRKRILLDQLQRLLRGYGNTYAGYPRSYPAAVLVVCDLDSKCLKEFRANLQRILDSCSPAPETRFCIAIEEGEAWLLGDIPAVKKAYPKARDSVLSTYRNDAICGTWECLAEAVYKGGARVLSKRSWYEIGAEKSRWAESICPWMDVGANHSPSFIYFREKLMELAAAKGGSFGG